MILMTTERLLRDGKRLESFESVAGSEHGWPSIKAATDHLHKREGIIKLPNGYEDKNFNETTGVKLRVTLTEFAA